MILSDYIRLLQAIEAKHGGFLEVAKWMPAKGRHSAPAPELAFVRSYHGGGGLPAFYHESDNPVQKGGPVVRV